MAFDPKRIDRLAAKATLLEEQVRALVAELDELAELARAESKPEPIIAHDPEPIAAPEPVAASDPEAAPDPASVVDLEPEAPPPESPAPEAPESEASAPEAPAPEAPGSEPMPPAAIPEGARVVALNMALSGRPRDETARYLRENYELDDPGPLLDDVYARAGS
jgi:hypothetical protein